MLAGHAYVAERGDLQVSVEYAQCYCGLYAGVEHTDGLVSVVDASALTVALT